VILAELARCCSPPRRHPAARGRDAADRL